MIKSDLLVDTKLYPPSLYFAQLIFATYQLPSEMAALCDCAILYNREL